MIKQRNVAISAIFAVITLGLYGIYWLICLTDESQYAIGDDNNGWRTPGVLVFIFNIITFGLYGWYWAYKMGERLDIIKQRLGMQIESSNMGVIYLILNVLGLGLITYILVQMELNHIAERKNFNMQSL